jgi:hypothetical protein
MTLLFFDRVAQPLPRRRPEEGEFLIRHALLDVLRALVLMPLSGSNSGFTTWIWPYPT